MNQQDTPNQKPAIIAQEQFRQIDINIAGTSHRIVCPVGEIKNLESSVETINQKIRDLRKDLKNKTPSNEELLVFVCLDFYDQIQALQNQINALQDERKQVASMIDKINSQARSML
ncbi:cell division protein ZapA [Moraxella marmotae]|uniref:cell division protein ZapA n=1 Tax=Moraxella marmotae TaxID=3344520 RepID=UPI0035D3DF23